MQNSREELEYTISQYLDGTLPPAQRLALEQRLSADAEARALLAEYRRLDAALKSASSLPQIAWEQLSQRISRTIAAEEMPLRHYVLPSIGWTGRLAVAAALLFAVGIVVHLVNRPHRDAGTVVVAGPQPQRSAGQVVSEVRIGPSPGAASDWPAGQEVVTKPTIVLIDRMQANGQDNDSVVH